MYTIELTKTKFVKNSNTKTTYIQESKEVSAIIVQSYLESK